MTTIAIPHWQGRVSPVFDVAATLWLVEVDGGRMGSRTVLAVPDETASGRAAALSAAGVDVVICGAVSWPLQSALLGAGIRVIPQICGDIERVLEAFAQGVLDQGGFWMPGCCGRRHRRGRRGCVGR